MRTVRPWAAWVVALLVAGCSASESSSAAGWEEASDYEYSLDSTCGERTLLGTFRVQVRGGDVVEVLALDERAQIIVADDELRSLVPTISDLLDEAADARQRGADVVDVRSQDDGRPQTISIDWDANAIDDEACYRITDYAE